jgi:hypothetical protein
MNKVEILPTWLYEFDVPPDIMVSAIAGLEKLTWLQNVQNYISESGQVEEIKQFKPVKKWANECLEAVRKDLNLNCEKLKVCLFWANKAEAGAWHHSHCHSNAWASSVMYLSPSGSQTWFSRPNLWGPGDVTHAVVNVVQPEDLHTIFKYPTTPGKFIIFPASLFHSVNEHDLGSPRYTLSFNAFPSGLIGDTINPTSAARLHLKVK